MAEDENEKQKQTQIALHAVKNVLGSPSQRSLFDDHALEFGEKFGIDVDSRIERFGIDLTDQQARIMEGILHGFSRTSYRGNVEFKPKDELASEKYGGKLPDSYRYVDQIPRLRVTQSEILEWAGVNTRSIEAWGRAVKAIKQLGMKQYCFFYDRLVMDDNGEPVKDGKTGRLKKESVVAVDTLFTVKEVRDGSDKLKYYEITPSAIFLDQRESYFMLVPNDWREEVRKLYGNKKASSYTFSFLLFLRYQYELKRRNHSEKKPYTIRWSSEQIAEAVNMPEGTFKKRKKRANEVLENAYIVAKKLGYLTDFERLGYIDVLTLNETKFHDPSNASHSLGKPKRGESEEAVVEVSEDSEAVQLFQHFHSVRKTLDDGHEIPTGALMSRELSVFAELLDKRKFEEIQSVISWSSADAFWAVRLSTARRLRDAFGEAVAAMNVKKGRSKASNVERNRGIAQRAESELVSPVQGARIEVLSKFVEIGNGVQQGECIEFTDKRFEEKLRESLTKWKFATRKTVGV